MKRPILLDHNIADTMQMLGNQPASSNQNDQLQTPTRVGSDNSNEFDDIPF